MFLILYFGTWYKDYKVFFHRILLIIVAIRDCVNITLNKYLLNSEYNITFKYIHKLILKQIKNDHLNIYLSIYPRRDLYIFLKIRIRYIYKKEVHVCNDRKLL